jgi:hypothetical protein
MREEHASCPVRADPFGHSNTEAWLLSAEAGMESLFWGRTDYQVGPAGAGAAELKGPVHPARVRQPSAGGAPHSPPRAPR